MAADGKTMKDAGVAWQTIGTRKAANPCREQHDSRVLYRLEQLLFVPGKRGEEAWCYGPISIISLEVPEPQTERAKPGQVTERKEGTFKERLLQELGGQCVYCGKPATDKDHIFPRARGGPDVWHNLVAVCTACNDEKGDRTPFQWLGSDSDRWRGFKSRVEGLPLSSRKKDILLNEVEEFPGGDPTPFARVGARPRQFVKAVRELFIRYGVPPPELTVQHGTPHIQRIEGRLTSKLRESWRFKADGVTENFPSKNPWDLTNHAQDAALIAACPSHVWRDLIFCAEGKRLNREGKLVFKPGLAIPELAPDWTELARRQTAPFVHVLGRYPLSWKKTIFKQTLWQNPEKTERAKLVVRKPVEELTVGEIREIVSPYYRDRLQALAKELRLEKKQAIPAETLRGKFPELRHLKVFRQKPSSVIVPVQSARGPIRYLATEPESASEGVVVWKKPKGKGVELGISVIHPNVLRGFQVPRYEPVVPPDADRLVFKRHQLIRLPEAAGHPAGWYRVKEFSDGGIVVLPECALPVEIANRIGLKKGAGETELSPFKERKLGKKELLAYYSQKVRERRDGRQRKESAAVRQ
jgi:5-methylcytosine-specific restriction endonuclease McrA